MSGICAIWRKDNSERVRETLGAVREGLALVPEERGQMETDQIAGLAVSSRFEQQQICQTPGALLACDADLTNENELWILLGASRPAPAGTAVLLASLYDRFGADFVRKLRGGFSIVLWDRSQRQLLAAVDDFGVKRLVYYEDDKRFLIASRIDALAQSGEIDTTINPHAIANVLNFTANLAPGTIYKKVRRLPPASLLMASRNGTRVESYWDMRYDVQDGDSEDHLAQKLEAVVEQAVRTNCGDQPFDSMGAFLSGGTDSSTVVGMMSRAGRGQAKAYSIGFEDQVFDEMSYARIAAERFQADHHTLLVGPDDCFNALPAMVRSFDEPFGNSSAIPTYFCSKLAADSGVQVLLGGDGGDELFGGNSRYLTDKIFGAYQKVPRLVRKGMIEPALNIIPTDAGVFGKAKRYIKRSNIPTLERYYSYHFLRANDPATIFESGFLETLSGYSVLDIPGQHYQNAVAQDDLDRLLYMDVKITLGDCDLPKVTCMAELAGIQVRFPFLDRRVAEFSGRIPPNLKVKGSQKRYLFKRAFRNLLPPEIVKKKKHGFGIPVASWIREDRRMREMARDVLLSSRTDQRGYFRRQFVEELFRMNDVETESPYYGDTLWTFLVMELWHRQFVDVPVRVAG